MDADLDRENKNVSYLGYKFLPRKTADLQPNTLGVLDSENL